MYKILAQQKAVVSWLNNLLPLLSQAMSTLQFIGCDSIQTCLFVFKHFQSHGMIYHEFKRIGQTNCTFYSQPSTT